MEALLKAVFSYAVRIGDLTVALASGRSLRFGDGSGPPVSVRFMDAKGQREFALNPALKLGELYMDGRLRVEVGDLYDLLLLMLRDLRTRQAPPLFKAFDATRIALWRVFPANRSVRSRRNVAHHYDIGDDLYGLFLDPHWQYSCAYFETDEQTLAEAQLAKMRHIAAKLLIRAGDTVLDIGSGWGGLGLYLARTTDATVLGVTLSTEQLARARTRAGEEELADRVRFELQDYRSLEGRFDRVVSVGMFEHVGLGFYDAFFQTVARRLKPGGVGLLHTIGSTGAPGPTNPWIVKHVFPGGHIPSLSDIVRAVERSGLVITDLETLGPHYARTLAGWRGAFNARRDEAAALMGERFCRLWEFYLCLSEVAFSTEDVTLYQIQLAHSRTDVPPTRGYIASAEHDLREREAALQA